MVFGSFINVTSISAIKSQAYMIHTLHFLCWNILLHRSPVEWVQNDYFKVGELFLLFFVAYCCTSKLPGQL
jgi:hypothetical protein